MALKLKYNICVNNTCTQLKFTEETGIYNATTNTTGYGTPNIDISDVLTAVLTITGPNGITYNIDLFATTLFPSNTSGIEYTLPLSGYGNPTNITDGQWYFNYIITTGEATYNTEIYKYFYCNSECCVTNMLPTTELCDCCENKNNTNYLTAWTFLQSLKDAAKCGDYANFTAIKKIVDKLCKNNDCKTCK